MESENIFSGSTFAINFSCSRLFLRDRPDWEGTVNKVMIVISLISNCEWKRATVALKLSNPGTALDSREMDLPVLSLVLVFVYSFICILFVLNQLQFLSISVSIHSGFSGCAYLKAVNCSLYSSLWQEKSETDDFPLTMLGFAEFVYISAHPLLFTCNGLGVVGIGAHAITFTVEEGLTVVLFREVDTSLHVASGTN